MRDESACDDNDDRKGVLNGTCRFKCAHTIKHKDESVEGGGEGGGLYWLSGGRCVVFYISKALPYISSPPSTSHGVCVRMCVCVLPVSPVLTHTAVNSADPDFPLEDRCASREALNLVN